MRNSKSLKILTRSTATLSHINIANKNQKSKHFGVKNHKKVKRNSTGNMEALIYQKSLQKNRQKVYGQKCDIFAKIQLSRCEPIPQIEAPTLIDQNDVHHLKKIRQQRQYQQKHSKNNIETKSRHLISEASILKKTPSSHLIKNNNNVKQNNKNTPNNKIQSKDQKKYEPFTENLAKYLLALKRCQTVQTLVNVRQSKQRNNMLIKTIENSKQKDSCRFISQKIKNAEQQINQLILQLYHQQKILKKDERKHQKIENYIYLLYLKIKDLKQGIKNQRKHRRKLENRLKQYSEHILNQRLKENKKVSKKYRNYQIEQQGQIQIYSQQSRIYNPSIFSHKKSRHLQDDRMHQYKDHFLGKKMQQILNFNYNSDVSDQQY